MKSKDPKLKGKKGFQRAFNRPCRYCDTLFLPTSRYTKLCDECRDIARLEGIRKRAGRYVSLRHQLANMHK